MWTLPCLGFLYDPTKLIKKTENRKQKKEDDTRTEDTNA